MRNLILISLNTARSRDARLLAHIYTRFPILKTYNERKVFFSSSYLYVYIHWTISNEYFQIFLYFGSIYSPFKPFLNSQKLCCQTSGSHFYLFSSIKNLEWKKSVFFFLLPIRIRILNHLKWIVSNIFAFWIDI